MPETMLAELTHDGEIVVRNPDTALVFFTSQDETGRPNGADALIERVRHFVAGFKGDVSTAKGRAEIKATAFKVTKAKTALEKEGKRLADEQKSIPKKIDACRRHVAAELEKIEEEVRRPLTEWEEQEKARVQKHRDNIVKLECFLGVSWESRSAEDLMGDIRAVDAVPISPGCEEFVTEYAAAKEKALNHLKRAYAKRVDYEAEQEELARLRAEAAAREEREKAERAAAEAKERDARIAREAAEKARQEEAERQQQALEEADRRRRKAEWEAQEAQRAQAAAEAAAKEAEATAQAKAAAEARAAAEAEAEEAARREENRRHVGQVNRAAMKDLIAGGLPEDMARLAVTLIAQKKIKNVSIAY